MFFYTYNESGYYTGQAWCILDAEETAAQGHDVYANVPEVSTTVPPVHEVGKWPKFSGGAWVLVDDLRGLPIYQGATRVICDTIEAPAGWSAVETAEYQAAAAWQAFKASRAVAVGSLKVTVSGMEFDADEESQGRMGRAIMAAEHLQSATIPFWKLADNTMVQNLPVVTMKDALAASIQAMAAVWLPE